VKRRHERDRLRQARDTHAAAVERESRALVIPVEPARADTELESPVRDHVERRALAHEDRRVTEIVVDDERADAQPRRHDCGRRERGHRGPRPADHVVGHREGAIAEPLEPLRAIEPLLPARSAAGLRREAHRTSRHHPTLWAGSYARINDMIRSRLGLAAILVAILLASCGGQPGVTVTVADVTVPMVRSSVTERTPCSVSHGDAFPRELPLTTVRATPVTLHFDAGQGASEIRGTIFEVDAPPPGGPIEEFTLPGRSGAHTARSIVPGKTYGVLVGVHWSLVVTGGEETHAFRLRIEPP